MNRHQRRYALLQTILCALLALLAANATAREKVTVFLRVDDLFSINSPIRPVEMDEFLKVAESHGARVILAAIPNRLLQTPNEGGHMTRALLDYRARGHQIIQHAYDHVCVYTGDTGREFSTPEALEAMTQQQRIEKILAGRRLLEAVLGERITGYCGPGSDDQVLLGTDGPLMREAGFLWLKDAPGHFPVLHEDGGGSYPVMLDFAWELTEENYDERMQSAKDHCMQTAAEGNVVSLKFHDPFTRAGYRDGITLRWLDEILTWLSTRPDWDIEFMTLDDYHARYTTPAAASGE